MKSFPALMIVAALMLAYAPFMILAAPYESTMGLVQKIFYFHVPSWFVMFTSALVCGVGGLVFLFTRNRRADAIAVAAAELATIFGLIGLVTGPLWARKAWGVWWIWDARLTSALVLWLVFASYLLLRRYGGPGSDRLAAGVALFGMATVPFVYWSVNVWRTLHPLTTVVPSLPEGLRGPLWWCTGAFFVLYAALMSLRVRLERQRMALDSLFLAAGLDEER